MTPKASLRPLVSAHSNIRLSFSPEKTSSFFSVSNISVLGEILGVGWKFKLKDSVDLIRLLLSIYIFLYG